ncbi:hypothetical protein ASPVEDRAFT_27523 [Aspergillus versicolor CBS 583.65]|uniref:Uncharacterized protein n=1 Tax=Aspergillus versicolor CBS 583.65 TaxID=1036611 RepID=A0A1L9PH37_ASPVE|nr:uncharacterized protein ASPVEDRAFT_27523 [Aspergillus versicolor CBS 583.65]OJJ00812.1 hypothetical protein ASPVEDRAFT_27523 [Aspergillus versicolor CBS 583.65]
MENNTAGEVPLEQLTPRETRAELVKGLQDTAAVAIDQLQRSSEMTQAWTLPARVFPQSILTMAACLASGSDVEVRSTQLDIKIPGLDDPQSSLNALLNYCSALGREAFEQSEKGMLSLDSVAASAHQKIEHIMQLVGRPERDAILQAELTSFQALGTRLGAKIGEMDEAFAVWTTFTNDLIRKLDKKLGPVPEAETSEVQLSVLQDAYVRSEERLKQIQAESDQQNSYLVDLLRREVPKACSQEEMMVKLREIVSQEDDGRLYLGIPRFLFTNDYAAWPGLVTAADAEREQAAVSEQIQALGKSLQSIERDLEAAKQDREYASERLIMASRSSSKRNLELLADSKLDLKTISQILTSSAQELKCLRHHISNLKTFFTDLSKVVENTVDSYESFHLSARLELPNHPNEAAKFTKEDKTLQDWCAQATDEIEELARKGAENVPLDIENSLKESLNTAMNRYQFWAGDWGRKFWFTDTFHPIQPRDRIQLVYMDLTADKLKLYTGTQCDN